MSPRNDRDFILKYVLPSALGLAAAALVFYITSRYGIGLAPDSANYVSAARSLAAGRGLLCFDGTPFTSWPPLYPAVLAVFRLLGVDVVAGARVLGALVFGATVFLSVRLSRTVLASAALVVIGGLFVLFSNTLQSLSAMLLSDAAFSLLALLFLAAVAGLLANRTTRSLVACCVLAALLCLLRYIGLAFVLSAILALLFLPRGWSFRRRLVPAAALLGSSLLPLAAWMLRNYLLTSTLTGERTAGTLSLVRNATTVLNVVRHWFLPSVGAGWTAWLVLALFAAALVLLLVLAWRGTGPAPSPGAALVRLSLVSSGVYLAALLAASSSVAFDEISARLLAPLYVPCVLLLLAGLDRVGALLASKSGRRRLGETVVPAVCALAVLHPLNWTLRFSRAWRADGMGGYTHRIAQESPLVQWLGQHPPSGRVWSNDPAAVYLLAGLESRMSLRRTDDVAAMCSARELKPGDLLVWFYAVERPYLYALSELREMLPMKVEHSAPDGAVMVLLADFTTD